jgi:hypothetical protein
VYQRLVFWGGNVYPGGEHDMTKLLLEYNADVNARNKNKKTCVHYAARNLDRRGVFGGEEEGGLCEDWARSG